MAQKTQPNLQKAGYMCAFPSYSKPHQSCEALAEVCSILFVLLCELFPKAVELLCWSQSKKKPMSKQIYTYI